MLQRVASCDSWYGMVGKAGCIIGHELSGHIAAVGEGVEGWSNGDAVVVMPIDPCFSCEPCGRGDTQICEELLSRYYGLGINPGGFGQYMLVRPSMLFRVPDGMDMKLAALTEPWAVAVRGVSKKRPPVAPVVSSSEVEEREPHRQMSDIPSVS
jgi:threonine dehydrogenase-like Zn-dependent dehydrogenase